MDLQDVAGNDEDFGPYGDEAPCTPDVSDGEDMGGKEGACGKPLPKPRSPSKAEWENHVVSHMPYRDWCRHCVAGRGLERKHCRRNHHDEHPHISIDYGYLTGDATPLLVGKDRKSGMTFAMAVERKGAGDAQAVTQLAAWIDALGSVQAVIRSDGEPSIM